MKERRIRGIFLNFISVFVIGFFETLVPLYEEKEDLSQEVETSLSVESLLRSVSMLPSFVVFFFQTTLIS